MKKTIAMLLVAMLTVGSVFAAFSGSASLGFGANLDNGNYGFIDSDASVNVDIDLTTQDAESVGEGDVYASIKGSLGIKVYTGEKAVAHSGDPSSWTNQFGKGLENNWGIGITAKITEAKVVGENWEVSILGLNNAPNYAKGFQTYTVEKGIDKWGFERKDFKENYNTDSAFDKATGVQAKIYDYSVGFGLVGDYDDANTWKMADKLNIAAFFETPEYDFDGLTLQAGAAYSYYSMKANEEGVYVTESTKKHNLNVSAKAGYATDTLSIAAATDVIFKFASEDVEADVAVDFTYDFLTANVYYGSLAVTGKTPTDIDKYTKSTSEDMLSAQIKTDLNSFDVPVALTVGVNDILAKQAISVNAEFSPVEGLDFTVKGGYTIDTDGRSNSGAIVKDNGRKLIGEWSAGVDAEYAFESFTVAGGVSAKQKTAEGSKLVLGMNASVESETLIPGATLSLAWTDAEDLLKAANDHTKELGKITASISMSF